VIDFPVYVWVLVLIGVTGIPVLTGITLYRGGLATGVGRGAARAVGIAFAAGWGVWVIASGLLAGAGAFRQDPASVRPWIAVALLGALAAALLAIRIPVVARILAGPGTVARLAVPQTLRVVGVTFLIVWALGLLPAVFALPAGLGDLAVGVAAPFVARGGAGALWFTILGIVDLVVAVSLGFLAGLGPTRVLAVSPSTAAVAELPLVLIPTTAVPLALALHVISLARLRGAERGRDPGPAKAADLLK
jgi:hypothetical protein